MAAISMVAWIGTGQPNLSPSRTLFLWSSQRDSGWFAPIAVVGYPPSVDDRHAAFFPLYPALIWLTQPLFGGNAWWAALVVANVASLAAVVVLYRFAEHEFDTDVAGRTTLLLLAYPTGFFLTAAYNEGLFIALAAASLYAMRRGHWWLQGILVMQAPVELGGIGQEAGRDSVVVQEGDFAFVNPPPVKAALSCSARQPRPTGERATHAEHRGQRADARRDHGRGTAVTGW